MATAAELIRKPDIDHVGLDVGHVSWVATSGPSGVYELFSKLVADKPLTTVKFTKENAFKMLTAVVANEADKILGFINDNENQKDDATASLYRKETHYVFKLDLTRLCQEWRAKIIKISQAFVQVEKQYWWDFEMQVYHHCCSKCQVSYMLITVDKKESAHHQMLKIVGQRLFNENNGCKVS